MLLLCLIVAFLLWAALFEIEQSVRAQGQIIPTARTQVIQSVDGGVLEKLLVEEGEIVKAGQELAVMERERSAAGYEESRAKAAALTAALTRAQAEAKDMSPVYPPSLRAYPNILAVQQALYEQRKRSLEDELATQQKALEMAREELRMNETLFKKGDTSRLEFMRAQRQALDIEGKIQAIRNKYLQDARMEASKLAEDLAANSYKLDERQSVLRHTVLTAPIAGVVKYLKVTTIGGVLRAGDELMQISPTESGMVFEVKVNPVDIGQLELGLPVSIKLDAFDYSVFGSLKGSLIYLSSDTLVEQGANGQSNSYYRAHVKLDSDKVSHLANPLLTEQVMKPGMTATVDIKTGRRSVLKYLAKPIYKAFGGAMNER
jgi:adhesin transport system membrane fusion protein